MVEECYYPHQSPFVWGVIFTSIGLWGVYYRGEHPYVSWCPVYTGQVICPDIGDSFALAMIAILLLGIVCLAVSLELRNA